MASDDHMSRCAKLTDAARRPGLLLRGSSGRRLRARAVRRHETHEHAHGRDELRFYSLCPVPDDLPDKERRRRLRAIGLAVNNAVRDGKERIEFR